jgi:hypothetical protein
VKAIVRWFRIMMLRREVRLWDQMIDDERRQYATHAERLRSMQWQRAPFKAELDRIEGRISILHTHSATEQSAIRRHLERMKAQ